MDTLQQLARIFNEFAGTAVLALVPLANLSQRRVDAHWAAAYRCQEFRQPSGNTLEGREPLRDGPVDVVGRVLLDEVAALHGHLARVRPPPMGG